MEVCRYGQRRAAPMATWSGRGSSVGTGEVKGSDMSDVMATGEHPFPADPGNGSPGSRSPVRSAQAGSSGSVIRSGSSRWRPERFGPRAARLGIFGAALAMLAGAAVFAMLSPALNTADETGHFDYAFQLWHGRLPVFEDGVMFRPPFGSAPPVQWEAQHPPLFYALLAPAVGLLVDHGQPMAAVLAARFIGAVIAALCVVGLGWAAGALTRRSKVTWMIVIAAVAAPISPFLRVGGSIYNDDLSVLFTVLALGVTLRAIRNGISRGLLVAAALIAAGGMLSRANFIITLLTMCGGLVLAWWIQSRSPWPRRIAVSIGVALIPMAAAGVASGWFYLRNLNLTGSFTGGHPEWSAAHLGRKQLSISAVLRQKDGGWEVLNQLYLQKSGSWMQYGEDLVAGLLMLSAAVFLVSVVLWVVRRAGAPLPDSSEVPESEIPTAAAPTRSFSVETARSLSVGTVMGMQLLITLVVLIGYMAGGGGAISRYLLPALFTIAVLFGFGVVGLARRLRATALALYSVLAWCPFVVWVFTQPAKSAWSLTGRTANGVPGVLVVLGLVLLFAGIAATVVAVHLANGRQGSLRPQDSSRARPS